MLLSVLIFSVMCILSSIHIEKLSDEQLRIFSLEKAVSIFKTMYADKNFFPPNPVDDILSIAKRIENYIRDSQSLDKK